MDLRRMRGAVPFAAAIALGAAPGAAHAQSKGGLKDGGDCGGFTVVDAAAWLKVPLAQVARVVQKSGPALWLCSFSVDKAPPAIAFSVEIAKDARAAAAQLERYRDHLVTAGETPPWKGRLAKGAYSDISGVGDEGVWTDINGAFTVRNGPVTVQVTRPPGKLEQVKLGEAVLRKF